MGNVDVYWLSTVTVALDPVMVTLMSWTNAKIITADKTQGGITGKEIL
jgi:hypothetical protein